MSGKSWKYKCGRLSDPLPPCPPFRNCIVVIIIHNYYICPPLITDQSVLPYFCSIDRSKNTDTEKQFFFKIFKQKMQGLTRDLIQPGPRMDPSRVQLCTSIPGIMLKLECIVSVCGLVSHGNKKHI